MFISILIVFILGAEFWLLISSRIVNTPTCCFLCSKFTFTPFICAYLFLCKKLDIYCIYLTVCDLCGFCALWSMNKTLLYSSFLLSRVTWRTKIVFLLICLSMLQKFCKEAAYLVPPGIFISLDWCFSKSGITQ